MITITVTLASISKKMFRFKRVVAIKLSNPYGKKLSTFCAVAPYYRTPGTTCSRSERRLLDAHVCYFADGTRLARASVTKKKKQKRHANRTTSIVETRISVFPSHFTITQTTWRTFDRSLAISTLGKLERPFFIFVLLIDKNTQNT